MIDAVLSYHMNPQTCGVAKFNHALAKRLGVPLASYRSRRHRRPLLSIKCAEWPEWWERIHDNRNSFELFFHDVPKDIDFWPQVTAQPWGPRDVVQQAWRVFAGNQSIASALRPYRPDVITAFCPSTIDGDAARGGYRVLAFGMAHKLNLPHFRDLKQRLDIEHPDYTIELSTAVHEGSPWDQALTESVEAMRGIFGDKLRVLGFLGDDALAKELRECDAVAAYYTPALRANNTTAWAALEAGKTLYTNTDEHSPPLDASLHSWDMLCALMKGAA